MIDLNKVKHKHQENQANNHNKPQKIHNKL